MIILVQKYGQLGNRLSYLKEFFAIALETNNDIIFFCFDEYTSYFASTEKSSIGIFPNKSGWLIKNGIWCRGMRILLSVAGKTLQLWGGKLLEYIPRSDENDCYVFSGKLIELLNKKPFVLFLTGWPCVPSEVIEKHAEKIRDYFVLSDEHTARVNRFIESLRARGDVIIGIHIRMGDYRHWNGGRFFFEAEEYVSLMRKIVCKHEHRKIVFLLCTNENQDWTRFEEFNYVKGLGDTIGDLYALAACDEIHGPQSSFSGWAAFNGKVPFFEMRKERY